MQTIIITTPGPQGPPGPSGSQGPSGSSETINTSSFVTTSSFNAFTSSYSTGSFTGSFTGSLFGTASYITGSIFTSTNPALSASYALTSSYAINGGGTINTSSFATTGSNIFQGNQSISGSVNITGSLSQGNGITTTGDFSHAEGSNTQALGQFSHAEGTGTVASGAGSHAEGRMTIASGSYSHAEGFRTVADGDFQHVQGQYNLSSSVQSAFIIGNGIDNNNRSNLVFASGSTFQVTGSLQVSGSVTADNLWYKYTLINLPLDSAGTYTIVPATPGYKFVQAYAFMNFSTYVPMGTQIENNSDSSITISSPIRLGTSSDSSAIWRFDNGTLVANEIYSNFSVVGTNMMISIDTDPIIVTVDGNGSDTGVIDVTVTGYLKKI